MAANGTNYACNISGAVECARDSSRAARDYRRVGFGVLADGALALKREAMRQARTWKREHGVAAEFMASGVAL